VTTKLLLRKAFARAAAAILLANNNQIPDANLCTGQDKAHGKWSVLTL
jgi:hypothetical protein